MLAIYDHHLKLITSSLATSWPVPRHSSLGLASVGSSKLCEDTSGRNKLELPVKQAEGLDDEHQYHQIRLDSDLGFLTDFTRLATDKLWTQLLQVPYNDFKMDSAAKLIKLANRNKHIRESLDIIEEALSRYRPENTCISFNGGKDCTALLHLLRSSVDGATSNNNATQQITAFYVQLPNYFEEESKFVNDTVKLYNLKLMQYSSTSLRESLAKFKSDAPHIEAIFIGTRKDDFKQGTQMSAMQPTDEGWAKFMRVNPILNWTYGQVWEFIRELGIPFCDLYNQGYSSLGTRNDTAKNSSLMRFNENGEPYYLPAWSLASNHEERLSRSSSIDAASKNDQK